MNRRTVNRLIQFLLTPLREGRPLRLPDFPRTSTWNFYSRPCGRGDPFPCRRCFAATDFYSRPCGRGDAAHLDDIARPVYFYSRPCGRGDPGDSVFTELPIRISTHAPAGGATFYSVSDIQN